MFTPALLPSANRPLKQSLRHGMKIDSVISMPWLFQGKSTNPTRNGGTHALSFNLHLLTSRTDRLADRILQAEVGLS
jgi:hypothetical protein